jgi:hypothetical protein
VAVRLRTGRPKGEKPRTSGHIGWDLVLSLLAILATLGTPPIVVHGAPARAQTPRAATAVVLANPADAYYALAEEIARVDGLPLVHSLDEALAQDPIFLLWVVSPSHLSDEAMVGFGLALRDHPTAISAGLISGATQEDARALWLRADQVRGEQVVVANAANPSGRIEAGITVFGPEGTLAYPLTQATLVQSLRQADYLTFTGHGGSGYLGLGEYRTLRAADVPPLKPAVIATGSCNTFRLWDQASIALAFVDQGAAAYAGFAYSPIEGYLIGEFDGLPFRYTWPGVPVGHVVQVQNRGVLQGFSHLPTYFLLGDPRMALQSKAPTRLVENQAWDGTLSLTYADAPPGILPLLIPGGAGYAFVEVRGVTAAWEGDAFYNARLQMADVRDDKVLLVAHDGGTVRVNLRQRPPLLWIMGDAVLDALDDVLLYRPQTGGAMVALVAGGLALLGAAWAWRKTRPPARHLLLALLTGLGFSALHSLYALLRLGRVTVISKPVALEPLALLGTFLLGGCGAALFLSARSWRGRVVGVGVASFGAWTPAVLSLGIMAVSNLAFFRPELGTSLYNYALGLLPLIAFGLEILLFGLVFSLLARTGRNHRNQEVLSA